MVPRCATLKTWKLLETAVNGRLNGMKSADPNKKPTMNRDQKESAVRNILCAIETVQACATT